MAFTHIQGALGENVVTPNTSLTITLGAAPTKGNVVCVGIVISCFDATTPVSGLSVTDANNNIYTVVGHNTGSLSVSQSVCAYLLNAPANASATINITWTSPNELSVGWADEFSPPANTTVVFDQVQVGTGTGTTINLPSITPVSVGELLYAVGFNQNTLTAPAAGAVFNGWTGAAGGIDPGQNAGQSEYILNSSTNLTSVAFSLSSSSSFISSAFAIQAIPGLVTSYVGNVKAG